MNTHKLSILIFIFNLLGQSSLAENQPQAIMPVGTIPTNSTVSLLPANKNTSYFNPALKNENGNELFQQVSPETLFKVQDLQMKIATAEAASLKTLMAKEQLMIQQSALTSMNCTSAGVVMNCTAIKNIPVFKAGAYDFPGKYMNMFGTRAAESDPRNVSESHAFAQALDTKISEVNKKITANKSITLGCPDKLPEELKNNKTLRCGLQQAQEALRKAKAEGAVKADTFIFNDFSSGAVTGKMWFLNTDGAPDKTTLDTNPIPVARGQGGFGKGNSSLKTPDGAITTLPFHPPREGNIKDGIEHVGLEPNNRDINKRGVLMHGWDPYVATQGCLGVAGSYHSNSAGHRVYGGSPRYLDDLKKGLLKNGGVMIYNFTPNKVKLCKD